MIAPSVNSFNEKVASKAPPTQVTAAYVLFAAGALSVHHFVANGEFSSVATMAVIFQCLSFALLALHSWSQGSVAGISARALGLEAMALICRLSSTTLFEGYLPVDASGDFAFQFFDVVSLLLVLWLLHTTLVTHKDSYQEEHDSLPALPMAFGSFLLAVIFHADMNNRPLFDALWMTGLFSGVVAVLPQLCLIMRSGGVVKACTSHSIAMMALSRLLSGIFMWYARFDITCQPWVEGWNHAVPAILGAHALHLILLADFGYYYLKAVMKQGLDCQITLPESFDMV
eukprot:TRINITY_DN49514_c0_g1_i1.p1 TRINITY_DN49514_c0_g1~~TRINITY_DN49514_c0_g1_i1.p1  ORF type:complete len:286 (-),score=52.60 TRINITY_DN49514_c0_g1_i1:102-959(-)